MRFELTQMIGGYTEVGDKYEHVTVKQSFSCKTYDDLQSLFLTLVDFGEGTLNFSIKKIEEEDD